MFISTISHKQNKKDKLDFYNNTINMDDYRDSIIDRFDLN